MVAEQEGRDMDLVLEGHDMVALRIYFRKKKSRAFSSVSQSVIARFVDKEKSSLL